MKSKYPKSDRSKARISLSKYFSYKALHALSKRRFRDPNQSQIDFAIERLPDTDWEQEVAALREIGRLIDRGVGIMSPTLNQNEYTAIYGEHSRQRIFAPIVAKICKYHWTVPRNQVETIFKILNCVLAYCGFKCVAAAPDAMSAIRELVELGQELSDSDVIDSGFMGKVFVASECDSTQLSAAIEDLKDLQDQDDEKAMYLLRFLIANARSDHQFGRD